MAKAAPPEAQDSYVNQEALDKLLPALRLARSSMGKIGVSGHNKYDDYDYSSMKDFAEGVEGGLKGNGLSVVVERVAPEYYATGRDKLPSGCRVLITGHVYHDSGQKLPFEFPGDAFDRGDKALYKAVTGARKYALACLFNLKAGTDPEGDEHVSRDGAAVKPGNPFRQPEAPPPIIRTAPIITPDIVQRASTPKALGGRMTTDLGLKPITAENQADWVAVASAAELFTSAQIKSGAWKEADAGPVMEAIQGIDTNEFVVKARVSKAGADAF